MPVKPLIRPLGDDNVASDLSLAAGLSRIVVFSNSGVRIMCKAGFLNQNSQAELNGANVNTAAFAPTGTGFTHDSTFDPRVIYDGYNGRFWAVAVERDIADYPFEGRLHISLSGAGVTNPEMPQSWSTTYWVKYTGDGPTGAAGPSLDPADDGVFMPDSFDTESELGHFPDRPTIGVDRDFLYICVREGTQGNDAADDRWMMVVMCKADLVAGTPTVVTSRFIDLDPETGSAVHALAVDHTIPGSGVHRVYMVTLPDLKNLGNPGAGHQFAAIRVGAFSGTGTFGECGSSLEWTYESADVALDSGDQFIGMNFTAPGAKGAASGVGTGLDAQTPSSLFMDARTRVLGDDDRRIWCIHNILPVPATESNPPPISQLQWYQINLNGWPDSGSPSFDRVERIALTDPYSQPVNVFDGAIDANECEDVAVGFTRGGYYNSGSSTWTYPQFWKALYPFGSGPTIAVVAAGASQYYDPGSTAWADFAGVVADPDPARRSRFYGHHMTAHADASGNGTATEQWESWLASWTFGSCNSFARADFDGDQDIDADDLMTFAALAEEDDMRADLDESEGIDALDLVFMLNAIGEDQP